MMDLNETAFGVLPAVIVDDKFQALTEADWSTVCPGYATIPAGFKGVIPYLFAAICFQV